MTFKDNFSRQAPDYKRYRPTYPETLYKFIGSLVQRSETAWDCATGNGQVAMRLADSFEHVVATDLSQQQLDQAPSHPRINYRLASATDPGIDNDSVDLITVAQAIHWFASPEFFTIAERVVRTGGHLAFWGYGLLDTNSALQQEIIHFYNDIVGPFWDSERIHIDDEYTTVAAICNRPVRSENFEITTEWSADELIGYFGTWSATQHYKQLKGSDPVNQIEAILRSSIKNRITIKFPVFLKIVSY